MSPEFVFHPVVFLNRATFATDTDANDFTLPGQMAGVFIPDDCQVRPGEVRPGEVRPGEVRPVEVRPGEVRLGEESPLNGEPDL